MRGTDFEQLESAAYRESVSDGVIDLFAGLSLIWIGACWVWLEAIAPFAAILPAALAPTLIPLRRRLIKSRAGYVQWTATRRTWERRQLSSLAAAGVTLFGVCVLFVALLWQGAWVMDTSSFAAAIPAFLVAIPVIFLAAATGLRRLKGYGFVLVVAAAATIAAGQGPGWPLLVGGLAMLLTGVVLLARFFDSAPAGDEA